MPFLARAFVLAAALAAGCSASRAVRGDGGTGGGGSGSTGGGADNPNGGSTGDPGGNGGGGTGGGAGGGGSGGVSRDMSGGGAVRDMAMARSCKRGVAYNNENKTDLSALTQGMGWWYDWTTQPNAGVAAAFAAGGVEYVPMVWSGPPTRTIDVNGLIASIPSGARYLLGFNEPNFGNQANLTPQQAAADWPLLEQIAAARNLKLVSPAVNYCGGNCNETDPFKWLDAFFAACTNCKIDYVAFHWYACTKDALTTMLGRFEAYGKPVWLTEFACLDSTDTSLAAQKTYMQAAVPVLEADPKVFRYSWFIGRSNPAGSSYDLFGAPGALTSLGQEYVGFSGACQP